MTRGRFLEETDINLEFESCEQMLSPRPKIPHIKQEPEDFPQSNVMAVKRESFYQVEEDIKPDLSGDISLEFPDFEQTLHSIKDEKPDISTIQGLMTTVKEERKTTGYTLFFVFKSY